MLEPIQRTATVRGGFRSPPNASTATSDSALIAGWRDGLTVLNLRGDADDAAFRDAVAGALGLAPPVVACTSVTGPDGRIVWAGPDDWFVVAPKGRAEALMSGLRTALAGQHHAVTDVSSGYGVLHLSGKPVRDVLAQGCPLDLHPAVFKPGAAAGSLFFKAAVWLWHGEAPNDFELLVRRSFGGYVWLMLERCTRECGIVTRRFL